MEDAEGFVVHGNKKAWVKYFVRAIIPAIIAIDLASVTLSYARAHLHQHAPWNITLGIGIFYFTLFWALANIALAWLVALGVVGREPLISVNRSGVQVRGMGWRSRRLAWEEIKNIYVSQLPLILPLLQFPQPRLLVVIPHNTASLSQHLSRWELIKVFGSAHPKHQQNRAWMEASEDLMDISPEEFMRRLNRYYLKSVWRPGLPGGPYPINAALPTPMPQNISPNIKRPRLNASQSRIMIRATMQRRALRRPIRSSQTGMRRVIGRQAEARSPDVIHGAPQMAQLAVSPPSEMDTRATPDELIAALEAIERRKAEAQRLRAEASAACQVQQAASRDASSEALVNRQGSSPTGLS